MQRAAAAVLGALLVVAGACGTSPDASDDPADAFVPEQVDAGAGDPDPAADPDLEEAPDEPEPEPEPELEPEPEPVEGVDWTRVGHDPQVFSGEGASACELSAVVAAGPGLVAVGKEHQTAAVWTSPDGQVWSRVPHDEAVFADGWMWMNDVVETGDGLVAVGRDEGRTRGAAWTSRDGEQWTRVAHEGSGLDDEVSSHLHAVSAGGPGLVAVGAILTSELAVWTSTDASSWVRVDPPEGAGSGQLLNDVIAAGPGFVAVGSDQMLGAGLVWTSPDGLSWTRVAHDDAVFGSGDERLVMLSVAEAQEGLVAVGIDRTSELPVVWTSEDGLAWQRLADDPFEGDVEVAAISAGGGGLVAVGRDRDERAAAVWTSP